MKNIFYVIISIIFLFSNPCFADEMTASEMEDYVKIYSELAPAKFSFIHGIDPDQYYDMQAYAYTPYPLFRLNSPLYFKGTTIEPGYYLLTPRSHDGEWYVLFKENGKIKYYIPVYNRDIVPLGFYETHLPKPKLTFTQKVHIGFINFVGTISSSSKRRPAPKTYLEVDEFDNEFYSVVVYYGDFRYHMVLKGSPD